MPLGINIKENSNEVIIYLIDTLCINLGICIIKLDLYSLSIYCYFCFNIHMHKINWSIDHLQELSLHELLPLKDLVYINHLQKISAERKNKQQKSSAKKRYTTQSNCAFERRFCPFLPKTFQIVRKIVNSKDDKRNKIYKYVNKAEIVSRLLIGGFAL